MGASPDQSWLFDSGASHHATSSVTSLPAFSEYGGPDQVHLGDGNSLPITHTGNTSLPTSGRTLSLTNVLCVPALRRNLVSVAQLCQTNSVSVEFFPFYFLVKDLRTGACLMSEKNVNNIYVAPGHPSPQLHLTTKPTISKRHHHLGHPSNNTPESISRKFNLGFKPSLVSTFNFDSCSLYKSHKPPFSENSLKSTKPLELI